MKRTPIDLRAEMLARLGTPEGECWWWKPCRAKKAMGVPDSVSEIVIGEDGAPQGWKESGIDNVRGSGGSVRQ